MRGGGAGKGCGEGEFEKREVWALMTAFYLAGDVEEKAGQLKHADEKQSRGYGFSHAWEYLDWRILDWCPEHFHR